MIPASNANVGLARARNLQAERNLASDGVDRLKCCSISGIVLEVVGLMYSNSYYYGRMDYYSGWTASFLALLGDSVFVCCTPTLQGMYAARKACLPFFAHEKQSNYGRPSLSSPFVTRCTQYDVLEFACSRATSHFDELPRRV